MSFAPQKKIKSDAVLDQVFRQAFTDVLYEEANKRLCPHCSKVLESAALDRYQMLVAKRREEIASLQTKIQKKRQVDTRRKELEKQNRRNRNEK
ncbi:hypothetical protein [Pedosphaera parvula]|uniref:Uncharacterized protein n=1 Tax=Pedosphaera parvula (strain Ellin514) TaxID=320771 RepID=B9XI13_PEDPL|nr:hypothetical protein [Pedosphaera parvula]EEF60506.1 hypothetical protein Cflav_PD3476 [Pedosphaera parvula Ellin514]